MWEKFWDDELYSRSKRKRRLTFYSDEQYTIYFMGNEWFWGWT